MFDLLDCRALEDKGQSFFGRLNLTCTVNKIHSDLSEGEGNDISDISAGDPVLDKKAAVVGGSAARTDDIREADDSETLEILANFVGLHVFLGKQSVSLMGLIVPPHGK